MKKSITLPLALALSLVTSLAGPALSPSIAVAAPLYRFSAAIAPTTSLTNQSQSYVLTFSNSGSSDDDVKSVRAAIPTGWSVSAPSLVLGGEASSGWDKSVSGGYIRANKHSSSGTGIRAGHDMTITFTATAPSSTGDGIFYARAYRLINFTQEFIQEGDEPTVTVTAPPVDVCPNLDGVQETVPDGYELVDGNCVEVPPPSEDVCPNLDGDQATVPDGYELVDGNCVEVTPPPTDVCPNLDGDQATVPDGYELVDGVCVETPPPVEPTLGSIRVCKVVADDAGDVVDMTTDVALPSGSFVISSITPATTSEAAPVGQFGSIGYTVPLTYNTTLLSSEGPYDAQCTTFNGLTLGGYYYDEESVSPAANWLAPRYNDQFETTVTSLGDFYAYDGSLYDGDSSNDAARNKDADGNIVLTEERPNRTLVVLNQAAPAEEGGGGEESPAPTVTTDPATDVASDGATLNGTVDPNGASTTCAFAYGTSSSTLDQTTPDQDMGNSTDTVPFSAGIASLDPDTTYYFSATCTNENGTTTGDVLSFTTQTGENGGGGEEGGGGDETPTSTPPVTQPSGGGIYLSDVLAAAGVSEEPTSTGGAVLGEATSSAPEGEVLGASTCGVYLNDYIKLGADNNADEVTKLQQFLNQNMGSSLPVTGFYGPLTFEAVKNFQLKYKDQVLQPWAALGFDPNEASGWVYKTTKRWINMLQCPELNLPVPQLP